MKPQPPPACLIDDPPIDPTPLSRDEIAALSKALAHPVRVQIVQFFSACRPQTVGEIASLLTLAQSTVSEHLRILRSANILRTEIDGPRTWHCLNRPLLERFARDVAALTVRTES
jgi:DNA-binding transcriptional ArsR family regulator